MNEEFEIRFSRRPGSNQEEDAVTIIKDGKVYENGKYGRDASEVKYSNPHIYLDALINIVEITESTKEKLGKNKFKVYKVVVDKEFVKELIKNTEYDKLEIDEDVKSEIWINNKNQVFQVIYFLDDLTIDANYFNVNNAYKIVHE